MALVPFGLLSGACVEELFLSATMYSIIKTFPRIWSEKTEGKGNPKEELPRGHNSGPPPVGLFVLINGWCIRKQTENLSIAKLFRPISG